jgi:predicted GH43/DUF377 family glycosyl hydrolase
MIVKRHPHNPIISPEDVVCSTEGWMVQGVYNCGAFEYQGRIGLLLRVTERPIVEDSNTVATPILDFSSGTPEQTAKYWCLDEVDHADPRFVVADYTYVVQISHLRVAWSDDGIHFEIPETPTLTGYFEWEAFGIQDPRVLYLDGQYTIAYSGGDHQWGVTIGLITTKDWVTFERKGVMFPPDNKDVAFFPEKISGRYCCLHRPSGVYYGGHHMWIGYSPDLLHWGDHRPLAMTRPGMWDSARIGCGPEPVKTDEGWLEIYHGSDGEGYYLGAMLLDLEDPSRLIARSREPLLKPEKNYEMRGFYDNVVFLNGIVKRSDGIYWLYYGAADQYTCLAELSVSGVLDTLH